MTDRFAHHLRLDRIGDGERLDLIPPIIAMIAGSHFDARTLSAPADDAAPIYVPLADGRVLAMPAARLRPIIIALHELLASGIVDPRAQALERQREFAALPGARGQLAAVSAQRRSWRHRLCQRERLFPPRLVNFA